MTFAKNMIIGYPLTHTLSPLLHACIYQKLGIDAEMQALPGEDVPELIEKIRSERVGLTAVTIPHKEAIIPYLDWIEEEARMIGAVNTIINRDGVLKGYNTDVIGIRAALSRPRIFGKHVLLLGAGGAARAVAFVVREAGGHMICVNRSREAGEQLVHDFGGRVGRLEDLSPNEIDVIINATSIGMYPHVDASPLPATWLRSHHVVFDVVYNPRDTRLLQIARAVGATVISGMEMFVIQAEAQVELWLADKSG